LEIQVFRGFFILTEIHNIPPNYPYFPWLWWKQ